MPETPGDVTQLLHRWREGSPVAEEDLFRLVLPDLERIARYLLAHERKGHSLQATDLVDQIYVRLVAAKDRDWRDRRHFFAIAGRAMRRYLIDYARARPKGQRVSVGELDAVLEASGSKVQLAMTVNSLLEELERVDPELCGIVDLKFFLGLTDDDAANVLGLTVRTFQRRWQDARRWLYERIEGNDASAATGA